MANFFGKGRVKVAQTARPNKFDLSNSHITTMDFYQLRPVYCTMLQPNDSLDVDMTLFSRLDPLIRPMFGDVRFVTRAFFVPFRVVEPYFNAFIEGTTTVDSNGSVVQPKEVCGIYNSDIVEMFWSHRARTLEDINSESLCVAVGTEPEHCDFKHKGIDGNIYGYDFTAKGKAFFNILVGLGYKPNFYVDDAEKNLINTRFKALNLLSYCKLHFDWYKNPAYSTFNGIEQYFNNHHSNLGYNVLYSLLDACYKVSFSADYFTSAWDNPAGPNNDNIFPDFTIDDQQSYFGVTSQVLSGSNQAGQPVAHVPTFADGDTPTSLISDYIIQTLHKMTDYIKRKQLSGSRVLDRYMTDYGVQLESAKLDRSLYLGKIDTPVQISDIDTTNQTQQTTYIPVNVGLSAGKGIGLGANKLCKFKTDEWGSFIVLSYIEPRNSYPFGINRQNIGVNREDFFISEFDGLGTQPIRVDELSALNMQGVPSNGRLPNSIFGFAPRFAEYKTIQDNISGDFLFDSRNQWLIGWAMLRPTRRDKIDNNLLLHSLHFTEANTEGFDNIWQHHITDAANSPNTIDHFYTRYIFRVTKYSHMCNMYDYHDFESDGKEILQNVNGTQLT